MVLKLTQSCVKVIYIVRQWAIDLYDHCTLLIAIAAQ